MKRALILLSGIALLLASCARKLDLDAEMEAGEAVCWMTGLADDTPVARLSIPGAHDAASASITAWTRWTRTQELSVAGLWNFGVRAFDLRPAWVDGELGIYHETYSAHVTFPQVMHALILALEKHPGECAIVLVRHEEEADGNDPGWASAMGSYVDSIRDHLVAYRSGITLGEMRGKILILSRNEYAGGPIGGYLRGWTSGDDPDRQQSASILCEDGTSAPFWVQDYYHPDGLTDKWAQIQGLLDATASASEPFPLVVNHVSGYTGSLPDYRDNARNVNKKTASALTGSPSGILMLDFAGVEKSKGVEVGGATLVKEVVGNN